MKKLHYTKPQIDDLIQRLLDKIVASGKKYDYVVGIRNGGIHVSVPLAKALGVPHKTVLISNYDRSGIIERDDFIWKPNGLLVDDLIDSGLTISLFKSNFGSADVAVLLWKQNASYYRQEPEFFAEVKPSEWVVFPWEVE